MNYEFLDGFNLFLQTAHCCRRNGAVAMMDCLRNEWITKNPFRYYKLKEDEVQAKEHLTAHELELLPRKALFRLLGHRIILRINTPQGLLVEFQIDYPALVKYRPCRTALHRLRHIVDVDVISKYFACRPIFLRNRRSGKPDIGNSATVSPLEFGYEPIPIDFEVFAADFGTGPFRARTVDSGVRVLVVRDLSRRAKSEKR